MNNVQELKHYIYRLYITFLKEFRKTTSLKPTSKEEDNIKAFCVLAHAGLEDYIETLSKNLLNQSYSLYKSKKFIAAIPQSQKDVDLLNNKISQLIKTLVLSSNYAIYTRNNSETLHKHKSKMEEVSKLYNASQQFTSNDLMNLTKTTESYAKEILKETTEFFKGHIEDNHGASLKYLLKVLVPVGIDIPNDILLNSLQKLAVYRGTFAHSKGSLTQIISATDILKYAYDTVKLCQKIEASVIY